MDIRQQALSRRTLLAGGGAAPLLLAACGEGGPAGGPEPGTGAPTPAVRPAQLQLWFPLTGQQGEHHARVNERFTSEQPGIRVEVLTVPEAELTAKLATAIAGGRPPDLAGLGGATRIAELIENKRVVSLTRYRRDVARIDWYDAIKRVVVRGDDLYAMPVQAATMALFYNVDLYQRAGLDPNAPPATWADLLANAKAIAQPQQQRWGHAIGTKPIAWTAEQLWIAYLWQAGGEWLTPDGKRAAFDAAAGVEALQFWVDLVEKHQVTPRKAVDNLVMGEDFAAGAVGHMTLYSIWAIRAEGLRFPVRTAPLPRHAQSATVGAMVTMPIFSESKQHAAAWTYLDWLSQPENLIFYLSGFGTTPPRQSVAASATWTAFAAQHPLMQPFVDSQPQARLPYFGKGAQEIAVQVAQAVEAAVFGQQSPRQALDAAAKQANAILARA